MRLRLLALCGALFLLLAAGHAQVLPSPSNPLAACTLNPSPCVSLVGTITGANGLGANHYTLSFKPSQALIVAGTGFVVPSSTNCATSTNGAVVWISDPLSSVTISPAYSGTLPPATYYVEYTFVDFAQHETLPSPEMQVQLTSTGSLSVQPPAIPQGVQTMNVYMSTTSGAETLQGIVTAGNVYVQSTPLVAGTVPPAVNETICQQVANDVAWPSGTGYNVALTDINGNTLPGYPMQWQLVGAGTTVNLSTGLPYYHGVYYFPTPIMSRTSYGQPQSINGPLILAGSLTATGFSASTPGNCTSIPFVFTGDSAYGFIDVPANHRWIWCDNGTTTTGWAIDGGINAIYPNTASGWALGTSLLPWGVSYFSGLNLSGQLTSTVSTGIAPFVVASQTVVPNLNVNFLQGATWASPAAIGTGTPNAGTFTTVTSTVSTGTAPFSVNSTTVVPNLNAGMLGGATFAAPSPIGTTTPNTGTFSQVTDNALASGGSQCVQATSGGVLSGTGTGCGSAQAQSATGCAPTGGAWTSCPTTITWVPGFSDTTYIVQCQGIGAHATGSGNPAKLFINSITKTSATVTTVYTGNAGSDTDISYTEIDCTAQAKTH